MKYDPDKIPDMLNEILSLTNKTQEQIGRDLTISKDWVNKIVTRKRAPSRPLSLKIAKLWAEVGGKIGESIKTTPANARFEQWVPKVSQMKAGAITDFEEFLQEAQEYRATTATDPKAIVLEVNGDSMEPEYRDGDEVTLVPSVDPVSGKAAFIRFKDGSATFKVWRRIGTGEKLELKALNPTYPPIVVKTEDVEGIYRVYELRRKPSV